MTVKSALLALGFLGLGGVFAQNGKKSTYPKNCFRGSILFVQNRGTGLLCGPHGCLCGGDCVQFQLRWYPWAGIQTQLWWCSRVLLCRSSKGESFFWLKVTMSTLPNCPCHVFRIAWTISISTMMGMTLTCQHIHGSWIGSGTLKHSRTLMEEDFALKLWTCSSICPIGTKLDRNVLSLSKTVNNEHINTKEIKPRYSR